MTDSSPAEAHGQRRTKVLIVAEHASARFGGEAALPLHYFRVLHQRGWPVWLVSHDRVRTELSTLFPDAGDRIRYVADTRLHRWLWGVGERLPQRLAYLTTGFAARLATQLAQRRLARSMVRELGIDVVHQPMPVSPKEPSLLHGLGAPVVVGPLNGGMDYPPGFGSAQQGWVSRLARAGRAGAGLLNVLLPGKRRAAIVLVANERTRSALPPGLRGRIEVLPENGVDLSLWRPAPGAAGNESSGPTRFVFMGRLVDWKAVDLLLRAFARARASSPMTLTVLGDGPEGGRLQTLAGELGLDSRQPGQTGKVWFAGWKSQAECASALRDSDALVLPSLWECGGAVVLEAMASAKPVIATAWGGPLDYLDEDCGILVPPDNPQQLVNGLAQALGRLAASPQQRRALGRHGRTRIEALFDWEQKVDRMIDLYRAAADSRSS
jgi:glycosyltransferase involved in cell wall biosynthesis